MDESEQTRTQTQRVLACRQQSESARARFNIFSSKQEEEAAAAKPSVSAYLASFPNSFRASPHRTIFSPSTPGKEVLTDTCNGELADGLALAARGCQLQQ